VTRVWPFDHIAGWRFDIMDVNDGSQEKSLPAASLRAAAAPATTAADATIAPGTTVLHENKQACVISPDEEQCTLAFMTSEFEASHITTNVPLSVSCTSHL
jgi:hypothetical protein